MHKIWIDDVRVMPDPSYTRHITSVDEALSFIDRVGIRNISLIDLDHDSGDFYDQGGDYIKILNRIEELQYNGEKITTKFRIHSMNSVGAIQMRYIIQKNGWKLIN